MKLVLDEDAEEFVWGLFCKFWELSFEEKKWGVCVCVCVCEHDLCFVGEMKKMVCVWIVLCVRGVCVCAYMHACTRQTVLHVCKTNERHRVWFYNTIRTTFCFLFLWVGKHYVLLSQPKEQNNVLEWWKNAWPFVLLQIRILSFDHLRWSLYCLALQMHTFPWLIYKHDVRWAQWVYP
jgi:hypothetical protein